MNLDELELFPDEDHDAFYWQGGSKAALLIHGFPGTPKEMRPIAGLLHNAGWSVRGILLPGFGKDIRTLFERSYSEWIDSAVSAIRNLRGNCNSVLLLGYSMGGAVAINAAIADQTGLKAMILVAPFWRPGTSFARLTWPVVRRIRPSMKPFKDVSFDDPNVRRGIAQFLPDLDLESETIRQALREFKVPASLFDQMVALGRSASAAAAGIKLPVLVLQGTKDASVPNHVTRQLIQKFQGPIWYREFCAGHRLIRDTDPAWPKTAEATLAFLAHLDDNRQSPDSLDVSVDVELK